VEVHCDEGVANHVAPRAVRACVLVRRRSNRQLWCRTCFRRHHLEAEFGRKVEFWFRLEAGDGPHNLPFSFREPTSGRVNLHLHGEVGCSDTEQSTLRRALQKAGGKWESRGVRYQAHAAPNPDGGYVSYAFKNDPRSAHRKLRIESEPSWCDDLLMVSLDLKRRSKALYGSVWGSVRLSGKGLRERRTAAH
jgi:hypothetical protein